jgi:hypothetical protein
VTIRTVPLMYPGSRRQRRVHQNVEAMIRYDKDHFFYELQALVILAGGTIPIEELKAMTIEELIDTLYTNNIEFEIRPVFHLGAVLDNDEHWEHLREATYRAQAARELAARNHAEARLRE